MGVAGNMSGMAAGLLAVLAVAGPVGAQSPDAPVPAKPDAAWSIPLVPLGRLIAPAPDPARVTRTTGGRSVATGAPQQESALSGTASSSPALPGLTLLAPSAMPDHETQPLVVVELFTSQGCSSCPQADQLLGELAARREVLPLSYHVDYWDYLGWADEFATPAFTRRQRGYASNFGQRAVYTPQFIVDGIDIPGHARPAELSDLIRAHAATPAPLAMKRDRQDGRDVLTLTPRTALPPQLAVTLVRYLPERSVEITSGENHGVNVTYRNVVAGTEMLAQWDGKAPLRLVVSPGQDRKEDFPADTRHAILVQEIRPGAVATPGHILTGIRLD